MDETKLVQDSPSKQISAEMTLPFWILELHRDIEVASSTMHLRIKTGTAPECFTLSLRIKLTRMKRTIQCSFGNEQ